MDHFNLLSSDHEALKLAETLIYLTFFSSKQHLIKSKTFSITLS